MVIRGGMLVILAGIPPITASFTNTEMGSSWFKKTIGWTIAFILYKPAAALIYAAAFSCLALKRVRADGGGVWDILTGLALMLIALLALPALLRFVAPMTAAIGAAARPHWRWARQGSQPAARWPAVRSAAPLAAVRRRRAARRPRPEDPGRAAAVSGDSRNAIARRRRAAGPRLAAVPLQAGVPLRAGVPPVVPQPPQDPWARASQWQRKSDRKQRKPAKPRPVLFARPQKNRPAPAGRRRRKRL